VLHDVSTDPMLQPGKSSNESFIVINLPSIVFRLNNILQRLIFGAQMLPHKKQLLRRNAWYRQQLPTQQHHSDTKQSSGLQQKTLADAANNPTMSGKH